MELNYQRNRYEVASRPSCFTLPTYTGYTFRLINIPTIKIKVPLDVRV